MRKFLALLALLSTLFLAILLPKTILAQPLCGPATNNLCGPANVACNAGERCVQTGVDSFGNPIYGCGTDPLCPLATPPPACGPSTAGQCGSPAGCANDQRCTQTGVDPLGNPTYSCVNDSACLTPTPTLFPCRAATSCYPPASSCCGPPACTDPGQVCTQTGADSAGNPIYGCTPHSVCGPQTGGYLCDRSVSQCRYADFSECAIQGNCLGSLQECENATGCSTLPTIPPSSGSRINFDSFIRAATPAFDSSTTLGNIISLLIGYIFPIAGFLLFLYLIYGGYQWLTSTGDPKKLQVARDNITYAIAGFIIIFVAYWVVIFLGQALGLDKISNIFGG